MPGQFFDLFLINPLTNLFVLLTVATGNAGIAIALLTFIIRMVTLPLYMKQMKATRTMAAIAPRMQEIQKRFKDPKRRSEEQMKMYREAGVNPLGCLSSMLLQFPILIALYSVFRLSLGSSPEALVSLAERLYGWSYLRAAVPLNERFLWLNLGTPDPLVIPITVAATTYILQKMTALPAVDERQRAQNSMMNIMMPLIFGWITITLPSGLGLYYVLSNVVGMLMQYLYVGGGPFNWRALLGLSSDAVLPRALEVRRNAMDAALRRGKAEDEAAGEAETQDGARPALKPRPSGDGASAARRRRRYASGRRRGRR